VAKKILADMNAKPYNDVQPAEAPYIFTVKRMRSWDKGDEILDALKNAIIPTLDADTEADAWKAYYDSAVVIFSDYNAPMTPAIRNDLIISFRQARQNALNRALFQEAADNPSIVAMRLQTRDDTRVRPIHKLWHGVVLPKDHQLLQAELRTPMDFGCRCLWKAVYENELQRYPLTEDIPETLPGRTYRYYAQPNEPLPETQDE